MTLYQELRVEKIRLNISSNRINVFTEHSFIIIPNRTVEMFVQNTFMSFAGAILPVLFAFNNNSYNKSQLCSQSFIKLSISILTLDVEMCDLT